MNIPASPGAAMRLMGLPRAAALLAMAIGLIALTGWLFDLPMLKSIVPGWVTMKANTAIGFVLAGCAVWQLQDAGAAGGKRLLICALAVALIALAALSLSQDLFSWDLGIDQLFFRDAVGAAGTTHPGRMAPNTAACFSLIGISALLLAAPPGRRRGVRLAVQFLSAMVIGVATLALLSYIVDIPMGHRWEALTPMAAHTALGCLAVAVALIVVALREDGGWAIDWRITAAFALSLLLTLMVSALSARTTLNFQEANRWLAHSHDVRFRTRQVLVVLESMEAAQRGFLLTGQPEFLQPFAPAVRDIGVETRLLRRLTADNPAQQRRLQVLDRAMAVRLRSATDTLQIYRLQGAAAAVAQVRLGRGHAQMQAIRALLAAVDAEEVRLTGQRQARSEAYDAAMFTLLPIGALVSLLILSAGLLFLNREAFERRRAESDRDSFFTLSVDLLCIADVDGYFKRLSPAFTTTLGWSLEELLSRPIEDFLHPDDIAATRTDIEQLSVPGASSHLFENRMRHRDGSWHVLSWKSVIEPSGRIYSTARDVTEARLGEQRIIALNAELIDGQAALQAANKELESFSYSISHDLRAPLRHIDGYARMLSEDAGDRLTPELQRFLQTIIDSARRMGVLIDDLLAFSRLGRKPVALQQVNMQDLVARVADEVRNDGNRQARIEIGELPQASGDPALLRQVWTNLLSNALKYSAPRSDQARVVVSGERRGDRLHYQVRDNGVGFDMRYADKLFGVFQRLHGHDEFEGTGVGLAIVQRIVLRHGGQVTASAEPDHGAIFSFDLPTSEVPV